MASIEDRLLRLEAIEEIKQLKARYCAFCDDHYNPDGIAALFMPDAVWDGSPEFGRHEGREAIRSFFRGVSGNILFAAHLVLNPIITVHDATAASGKWRLIMPCTVATDDGSEARWLLSEYDEDYIRHEGAWLFQALKVKANFYASHLKGWV